MAMRYNVTTIRYEPDVGFHLIVVGTNTVGGTTSVVMATYENRDQAEAARGEIKSALSQPVDPWDHIS